MSVQTGKKIVDYEEEDLDYTEYWSSTPWTLMQQTGIELEDFDTVYETREYETRTNRQQKESMKNQLTSKNRSVRTSKLSNSPRQFTNRNTCACTRGRCGRR